MSRVSSRAQHGRFSVIGSSATDPVERRLPVPLRSAGHREHVMREPVDDRVASYLDSSLAALLHAGAAWGARLESALARVALSQAEYAMLGVLTECGGELTLHELARHTVDVQSHFLETVDRLQSAALLRRTPDPCDQHAVCVRLTTEGRVRYAAGVEQIDRLSVDFADAMPAADRTLLAGIMSRLA